MKTVNNFILVMLLLGITTSVYSQKDLDVPKTTKDQVFFDDVIVNGSECVGLDCVNGESFGFDTKRLKENNLRLHFDDTSNSASFPKNDWRIVINDSSNGGDSYFGIEDATAGRMPFRVVAGAPVHSLYVRSSGNVGLGTNSPVVELHIKDGDTPTMRLEQDGSSGFTQQTWDVAGNETNFFVRDVTNGSKLPFKIRPGALNNSLVIDDDGEVGVGLAGTEADAKLHVVGSIKMVDGNQAAGYVMTSDADGVGSWQVATGGSGGSLWSLNGSSAHYNAGNVGINTATPAAKFHVALDAGTMPTIDVSRTAAVLSNNSGSTDDVNISLISGTNAGVSSVFFGDVNNQDAGRISYYNKTTATDEYMYMEVNTNEVMRMLADGSVGIGTITPGTLLEVNGTASKPGGGSWAVASDKRLKKNINKYEEGLEEVLKFKPVTFQYNGKGGISDTNTTFVGLIAQEAQDVASHMVSNVERATTFKNGGETPIVREEYLMLDPSAIPYMLINSIKEQQAQLDAKDVEIDALKDQVNRLDEAFSALIDKLDGVSFEGKVDHEEDVVLTLNELPFLKQNVPNPYNEETLIEYFVPDNANSSELFFYDNQGKLLKKHVLGAKGFGKINLKAADLPSGTYVYSLVIDGKMVSSKKMSIQ